VYVIKQVARDSMECAVEYYTRTELSKAKGKDVDTNRLQDCHKLHRTKDSNASFSRSNVPN